MILSQLRDYLKKRGQASVLDLALRFDADPDAVRGMLEHWLRKGKVIRRNAAASCGSNCTMCDPAAVDIYQWNEAGQAAGTSSLIKDLGCPG